jgi:hypothetical protein
METWFDQTFRTGIEAEVTLQPDGTVELSWPVPEAGSSRVTVVMPEKQFRALIEKARDLLMVGAAGLT